MRIILDANVAIAAVAARGLCEAVLELCLERHHIILGEGILKEIEEKLRTKIKLPPVVIAEYVKVLRNNAEIVEPMEVDPNICRDPGDLMILGLVEPGNAEVVVTGDEDLLVIREYSKAHIITPRSFWELNQTPAGAPMVPRPPRKG